MSAAKKGATKTAKRGETEQAARNREQAAARAAGKEGTHDANPDNPTDSSVRHAEPQTGKQSGEGHGGYPGGEYDVVPPSPFGPVKTKGDISAILEQHYTLSPEVEAAVDEFDKRSQLSEDQFWQIAESLEVGAVIEHIAPNSWRCHVAGKNRFGHGATFAEAMESYALGTNAGPQDLETKLKAMPAKQRKEIEERDKAANERVGGPGSKRYEAEQAQRRAAALARPIA